MHSYRIGIIGFGSIGKVHAWSYSALPYYYNPLPFDARVVAVATAHQDSADAAARVSGAERASTDFRDITEAADIDVVHICSPNHQHLPQLRSALSHNKHIYCDKPLLANWAEAVQLLPALAAHRGHFGVAFQIRFFPVVLRAAQLLSAGRLGRILSFRVSYLHSGSADPEAPAKWKMTSAAGGGVIADLASHVGDLLAALGAELTELSAQSAISFATRPAADDPQQRVTIDAEDHVVALVRAAFSGAEPALGTIEATKIATGSEDELRLELHGTDGALRFNSMTPHWLELFDATRPDAPLGGERGWTRIDVGQRYPEPAAAFPGPKFAMGWVRCHLASIAEFLFALHHNRSHRPGIIEALWVQQLIETLQRSARLKQSRVPLTPSAIRDLLQDAVSADATERA